MKRSEDLEVAADRDHQETDTDESMRLMLLAAFKRFDVFWEMRVLRDLGQKE